MPHDADLLCNFVRTLSDEARHFRFMTKLSELSEAMAERFASIEYHSHVALIAATCTGFSVAQKRQHGRLVHMVKQLVVGDRSRSVSGHSPAACAIAA